MRKAYVVCLVLLSLGLLCPPLVPESPVAIKLGPPLEIGRSELLFGSLASICEDDKGDFYVLDQREQTVFKFSPDGRLLLKFGRKGQGPGDFQSPGQIVFTAQHELAVLEDLYYVSFHKTDGAFIRRLDLNGRLGLGYVGPDRYYGWEWRPESRQQLLVDAKNSVVGTFHAVARDRFSALLPDETGRMVMFNYSHEAYVPQFLFAHGDGISAIGLSDRYEIALLDENGRTVTTIRRDLKPQELGARERDFLKRGLRDFVKSKSWPDRVARELGDKIPAVKNVVSAVLVSPEKIFVFRFPPDITADPPRLPVDIFTRNGSFLGTADLPEVPLFVSANAMYFSRADADGNLYLVRQPYSLKP
jgi:hypothetical protein